MPSPTHPANPFRIGGVVTEEFFTDRAEERRRIRRALTEPQAHLLVYGPRRMGKTSTLAVVRDELVAEGHAVVMADLSTASTLVDMGTRILQEATRALGRRWGDVAQSLLKGLKLSARVTPDPGTGLLIPSLDVTLRDVGADEQRQTLTAVLDAIERLATDRKTHVGLVLDEFQDIARLGGVPGEAALRATIQHHRHVSYVLAGSDVRLIEALTGSDRPLFRLLDRLHVGPIDPEHLARWVEERMVRARVRITPDLAARVVRVAGPRTRDVVQLARAAFDLGASWRGEVTEETVEEAFRQIVADEDAPLRLIWDGLSPLQQNVLRAAALRATGLTTKAQRHAFTLGATGAATKAARTLEVRGLLVKQGATYVFDSPFLRGWMIVNALPDVGISLPILHDPAAPKRLL